MVKHIVGIDYSGEPEDSATVVMMRVLPNSDY
jgi:hypothetical protein